MDTDTSRSLLRLLRHDRRHGRALRPACDRHRQRRQLDHLGHGHQPPGRQHGSRRLAGRSGRQPARDGDAQLDRQRRRLRDRLARLCLLARGSGDLEIDSGRLRHDRRHGRALRPARHGHRQRRQPDDLGHGRQPPGRQHRSTASLDDPGANLRGTVTLSSTASDAGSGIATRTYAALARGRGHLDDRLRPPSTRPPSRTGSTTCASPSPTTPATEPPRPRSPTAASTTRLPSASLDDPGANLRGTVTLSSTASDAGSGIATRTYQHSPAGAGTWTTTPAAFDTTAVTDGLYDLRVTVTDNAGNSTTSATVANRRVDNTAPSASLTAPADGSFVSATVAVSANSSDPGGSGVDSLLFERRPAGGGSWTAIDTDSSSPYSVSWDTSALADGDYELRASASDQAGNSQLSALRTVTVDNTGPRRLARRSRHAASRHRLADRHCIRSGWSRRRLRCLPALAGKRWQLDDSGHGHELALLRLLRHDRGGGRALRPPPGRNRPGRQYDQSRPSSPTAGSTTRRPPPRMDDPGANLRGTVTLSSTASDAGSGIASRVYAYSPAGAGTWTTTPAAFDTTAVTDGLYDLRVTVTDNAGNSTTSATVANRRVDNTAPERQRWTIRAPTCAAPSRSPRPPATRGSGVATLTYQHSPAGAGTWTTTPAAFDTTAVTDGLYDLRVIVTDNAGNSDHLGHGREPAGRQHQPDRLAECAVGRGSRVGDRGGLRDCFRSGRLRCRLRPLRAPPGRCAAPGLRSTPTRARPTPSPGTRARSLTGTTSCGPSSPTSPETATPRRLGP